MTNCEMRGVEPAHVLVEQVVTVIAAELVERLRDLALLWRHHVPPHAAIVQLHLRRERRVGIDGVAGMDEDVGATFRMAS